MKVVGVVSDTHGLLRPEVLAVFRRVELILHAGDIGDPDILRKLGSVAPVIAVRGNNDKGKWAAKIPEYKVVEVGSVRIYLLHNLKEMVEPSSGFHAIVTGHSHRPSVDKRDGILFVNPGSAGPRRFKLPVSVALLTVDGQTVKAQVVELPIRQQ